MTVKRAVPKMIQGASEFSYRLFGVRFFPKDNKLFNKLKTRRL